MSFLNNLMSKVFGKGEYQVGDQNLPEPSVPAPTPYQPSQEQGEYQPQPQQSEYGQTSEQRPEPPANPFDFPAGDKPPIPAQYHEQLSAVENGNVIASVLAQETGGYGYGVPDPETGEVLTDWKAIQDKQIRGESGEVGMSQIIPKWYWKDAGFPDEESYAQALYNPTFAIEEAGRILNKNFSLYGDWDKALGAWNKNPSFPKEVLGRIGIQQ